MQKNLIANAFWLAGICLWVSACQDKPITFALANWQELEERIPSDVDSQPEVSTTYEVKMEVMLDPTSGGVRCLTPRKKEAPNDSSLLVPVIRIQQEVFDSLGSVEIPVLAQQIHHQLSELLQKRSWKACVIDVTWKPSQQGSYFGFLSHLKNLLGDQQIKLGAVVPLPYFRYREEVGVPPADFGVLTLHNSLNLFTLNEKGKLLDDQHLIPYLAPLSEFPLTVHVLLPGPSWGVVVRAKEPVAVLPYLPMSTLIGKRGIKLLDNRLIKVSQPIWFDGLYLEEGDVIRVEKVTHRDYQHTLDKLLAYLPGGETTIIYRGQSPAFDLDALGVE